MQQKFYVSHETKQMGPYTIDEIVSFVGNGTLSPLDYLYDEKMADWIVFLEYPALTEKIKSMKPKAPPKASEESPAESEISNEDLSHLNKMKNSKLPEELKQEWFVLKGENKFGPFTLPDVVKMLQQGVVFEYDFAWHKGMSAWERLAEISHFSRENLKKLKDSNLVEVSAVFFRRRYKRAKYGGTILVHDNKKVWKGQGVEISEGGAGVIMENAMVLPGEELYLHFKPGDGVPPFNAICEVVSKEYVSALSSQSMPIRYGLKFKTISAETQKLLKDMTKKVS